MTVHVGELTRKPDHEMNIDNDKAPLSHLTVGIEEPCSGADLCLVQRGAQQRGVQMRAC